MQNCLWSPQSAVVVTSFGEARIKECLNKFHFGILRILPIRFFFLSPRQQRIKSQQKAKRTCLIECCGCHTAQQIQKVVGRYKSPRKTILLWGTEHTWERGCGQKAIISGRLSEYEVGKRNFLSVIPAEASAPWPSQRAPLTVVLIFPELPEIDPVAVTTLLYGIGTSGVLSERKSSGSELLRCYSARFEKGNGEGECLSEFFLWETHHHITSHILTLDVHFVIFLLQLVSLETPVLVRWAEHYNFSRNMEDCCTKPSDWGKRFITLVHFHSIFQALSACVQLLAICKSKSSTWTLSPAIFFCSEDLRSLLKQKLLIIHLKGTSCLSEQCYTCQLAHLPI